MIYRQRNIASIGGHYTRHLDALTTEQLTAKSDIAAELAWRDAEIERVKSDNDRLDSALRWLLANYPAVFEELHVSLQKQRSGR